MINFKPQKPVVCVDGCFRNISEVTWEAKIRDINQCSPYQAVTGKIYRL